MRSGLCFLSVSKSMFSLLATPGRNPSRTMSHCPMSFSTTALDDGFFKSSEMLRLLRFSVLNCTGTYERPGSPLGCSTLMTSAPRSASSAEQNGPGTNMEKSTTRTPASGSQGSAMSVRRLDPVVQRDAAVDDDGRPGDIRTEALGEDGDRHAGDVGRRAEAAQRNLLHHARRRAEAASRNGAGGDRVDADPMRPERARQLLHQHRLARLGCAVVRQVARRLGVQ